MQDVLHVRSTLLTGAWGLINQKSMPEECQMFNLCVKVSDVAFTVTSHLRFLQFHWSGTVIRASGLYNQMSYWPASDVQHGTFQHVDYVIVTSSSSPMTASHSSGRCGTLNSMIPLHMSVFRPSLHQWEQRMPNSSNISIYRLLSLCSPPKVTIC